MMPSPLRAALFLLVGLCLVRAARPADALETLVARVDSPDGRLAAEIMLADGRPQWRVVLAGAPVLERGALGLRLGGEPWRPPFVVERTEAGRTDDDWTAVWGNRRLVPNRSRDLRVTFREAGEAGRRFEAHLRCFDEGVALRYVVPAQPGVASVVVRGRDTEYRFAPGSLVYHNRKYEYGSVTTETMTRSEGNVTVAAGGGRFVSLTDADCADFSRVAYQPAPGRPGVLVGSIGAPAVGTAPFATSWEVVIAGVTAAQLYEHRHIVENLNPPCALPDTSWIRPGKAVSQVRNARRVTADLEALVDFAASHGMDYLEIDHSWCGAETKWTPEEIAFFERSKSSFWDDKPEWRRNVGGNPRAAARGWVPFRPKADTAGNYVDFDPAALAAYGRRSRSPVGICLYVRGAVLQEFGGEHPAEEVFATYERWGIAGIKLGFVPNGSQKWERAVADVVAKAARHRLIVCIHDGYYPSGLSRTYPNLVNIEGVAGDEAEHSIAKPMKSRHDVMLPFTRALMGPVDYTPEMFKAAKTHAHQVALVAVYHGRPSIRGGLRQWSPGGEGGSEVEFVRRLPGLFDEIRVFTELGRHVTVARRAGETWYVATLGDGEAHRFGLPLDFLRPGTTYQASLHADTPGARTTTAAAREVTAATVLPIALEPDGGHVMILDPRR